MTTLLVTLESSAAVGALPGSAYFKPALDHIPASVVRGAIAAAWLRSGGTVDDDFVSAFERDVVWGPFHKPGSRPQPLSHWLHKYPADAGCRPFLDESTEAVSSVCPDCQEPLEASKGGVAAVAKTQDTHVQLQDGTALEGALFARERIARGQSFQGNVTPVSDRGQQALDLALARAGCEPGTAGQIWVGGRRSTDGGRATLRIEQPSVELLRFEQGRMVFTLLSPGIFVDDAGLPQDEPRYDDLAELLGVSAKVERKWTRWTTVGGWHAASGLPKPVESAVAAGSVYELTCDEPSDDAIANLAALGLGLRRVEGFGAVGVMPSRPPSAKEIGNGVAPLKGLKGMLPGVIAEIDEAADAVSRGGMPSWRSLSAIAGNEKAPVHVRDAASFVQSLKSEASLRSASKALRSAR